MKVILELACRYQSIEYTARAVFVGFWLVLPFREGMILYDLVKKYIIVLYLKFSTQKFSFFSASDLFLKAKENCKPSALKVVAIAYERCSVRKGSK